MQSQTAIRIISQSNNGLRTCAAAGRISTQEGAAMDLFHASQGGERDIKLIRKVLASGHKSVLEHHSFSVALQNVSVLVEQFFIEHRLASFIVKSRRYVNFEKAGFYIPQQLTGALKQAYESAMSERFSDYGQLLALGIPKEDARFVLPYCFFSNLYLTCNARELVYMICSMRDGRGCAFPEIRAVGAQLEAQFNSIYPGIVDAEKGGGVKYASEPPMVDFLAPHPAVPSIELLNAPTNARELLASALSFTGRFDGHSFESAVRALTTDSRPRELECLNYTFMVKNVSLATITHYARHRIQSPLFLDVRRALAGGGHIIPDTVSANEQALAIYERAFTSNHDALKRCVGLGLSRPDTAYFALAGCTSDIMITMNAREMHHFLQLRTCTRAQWEIRELSLSLLEQLRESEPSIFHWYGPSCAVQGRCPEGKMSCGEPKRL